MGVDGCVLWGGGGVGCRGGEGGGGRGGRRGGGVWGGLEGLSSSLQKLTLRCRGVGGGGGVGERDGKYLEVGEPQWITCDKKGTKRRCRSWRLFPQGWGRGSGDAPHKK